MVTGSRIVVALERAAQLRRQRRTITARSLNSIDGPQVGRSHLDLACILLSLDIAGSSGNMLPSSKHRPHNLLPIKTQIAIVL